MGAALESDACPDLVSGHRLLPPQREPGLTCASFVWDLASALIRSYHHQMAELEHGIGVDIGCRCIRCGAEADLDRLKEAGAKISREVKVDGRTVFELEVPDPLAACKCGSRRFSFRWSWG